MDFISANDIVCLKAILTASALYSAANFVSKFRQSTIEPLIPSKSSAKPAPQATQRSSSTRSIRKLLDESNRGCVVFYGSETGTAERLATCFVRDAKSQYGLESVAVDLEDCDYNDLANLGTGYVVVLLLATAGEGEPTTNAGRFTKYLLALSDDTKYDSLQFAAFGLGSSSYRHFNQAIKSVDARLGTLGALRLGNVGLGDDGKGTLEDDFLQWSTDTLPHIAARLGLSRQCHAYKPAWSVEEHTRSPTMAVLDGEPNNAQLHGRIKGPFTAKNPFPSPLVRSYQLASPKCERKCTHIEFDISLSTLAYSTGDHLALMPTNCKLEVERFLEVFGLKKKADTVIDVTSTDPTVSNPFSALTTYRAALSRYLNICGPVTRKALLAMSEQTSNPQAKKIMCTLVNDEVALAGLVRGPHLNLAQTLQKLAPAGAFRDVDFGVLIEVLGMLKPRYYSISSSSLVSKKTISITVMEEKKYEQGWTEPFKGVSTGYLADLVCGSDARSVRRVSGPNGLFDKPTAYIHVRRSQFRLPKCLETPIIMFGPGTGVAPFRAFVQERAYESQRGRNVGKTLLFYGCRRGDEDFLYKDEFFNLASSFQQGTFEMHTAFSREPNMPKQYVQDKLEQEARQVCELILYGGAYVYVCGNARRMAKDVHAKMVGLMAEHPKFNNSVEAAEELVKVLKKQRRWQEDVW